MASPLHVNNGFNHDEGDFEQPEPAENTFDPKGNFSEIRDVDGHPDTYQFAVLIISIGVGAMGRCLVLYLFPAILLSDDDWWTNGESDNQIFFTVGAVLGSYPAGQFVGAPLLLSQSDRVGRRPILILIECMATTFLIGVIICQYLRSWVGLIVVTFIAGVFESSSPLVYCCLGDLLKDDKSKKIVYFAHSTTSLYLGYGLATGFGMLYYYNEYLPCVSFLLLQALWALVVYLKFEETCVETCVVRETVSNLTVFLHVFQKSSLLPVYWGCFLSNLVLAGFRQNASTYLAINFDLSVELTQLQFLFGNIVGALWLFVVHHRVTSHLQPTPFLIVALTVTALSLYLLTLVPTAFPYFALAYIPMSSTASLAPLQINLNAPKELSAQAQGNNTSLKCLADFAAALLGHNFYLPFVIHRHNPHKIRHTAP